MAGRTSGGAAMAAAVAQADSGREMARPSSWRGGRGEGQGVAAWGVRNRGSAVGVGRNRRRADGLLLLTRTELEVEERGKEGKGAPGTRGG